MNNFTVTGYVCKDAEVTNFKKAAIARFGIIIKHTEHRGNETITISSILSLETWVKKDDSTTLELLKKGKEVKVEGFFKPESYTKDGKNVTILKNIVTKVSLIERKRRKQQNHRTRRLPSLLERKETLISVSFPIVAMFLSFR